MAEQAITKTILVCDDDDILVSFYKRVIKSAGYEVVTAANGDEAIKLLRTTAIDVAIIDLLMPICSGWEVIEFIKNHEPISKMPIIAVTGLSSSPEELTQVKLACRGFINKGEDFDVENFINMLKQLTRN